MFHRSVKDLIRERTKKRKKIAQVLSREPKGLTRRRKPRRMGPRERDIRGEPIRRFEKLSLLIVALQALHDIAGWSLGDAEPIGGQMLRYVLSVVYIIMVARFGSDIMRWLYSLYAGLSMYALFSAPDVFQPPSDAAQAYELAYAVVLSAGLCSCLYLLHHRDSRQWTRGRQIDQHLKAIFFYPWRLGRN